MYLFYYATVCLPTSYSCLVRTLILNATTSVFNKQKGPILWTNYRKIYPKMHGLAYKISNFFWG